jgi:hypothetical protein
MITDTSVSISVGAMSRLGYAASYEFAGGRVYTYKELVRTVADRIEARPRLVLNINGL